MIKYLHMQKYMSCEEVVIKCANAFIYLHLHTFCMISFELLAAFQTRVSGNSLYKDSWVVRGIRILFFFFFLIYFIGHILMMCSAEPPSSEEQQGPGARLQCVCLKAPTGYELNTCF